MKRNQKFTALFAILVVGFLSIYANVMVFNSSNSTNQQLSVTLNLQSGGQIPMNLAPGQNVPTQLNGDQVVAVSVDGAMVPAGANAVVPTPNGNVQVVWQMVAGQASGCNYAPGMPDITEQS